MSSPIDVVGPPATLPANYDPTRATVNTSGTGAPSELLDSQAFLQLLVAQLKYQDPTNPVDTSNFMNQTAMLSQVQTMNTMSSTLTELVTSQRTASATGMIGKVIAFVDPVGNQVEGIVDAVSIHRGTPMLHVGNLAVPLNGVLAVTNPIPIDDGGVPPEETVDPVDEVDPVGDGDPVDEVDGIDDGPPDDGISAPVSPPETDPDPASDPESDTTPNLSI